MFITKSKLITNLMIFSLFSFAPYNLLSKPSIASDIYPIQQIANAISGQKTELVSETYLSPHSYQITPQKAQLIKQVDLFIWVGKPLMPQISKIVSGRTNNTLTLIELPSLKLLSEQQHDEDEHEHNTNDNDKYSYVDAHIWLSTYNVRIIAQAIATKLIELDNQNKDNYLKNLSDFNQQIDESKQTIDKLIQPIKNQYFYVFHDAYHYFEDEFGIKKQGVIKTSPNQDIRAKHLVILKQEIQQIIATHKVVCLFTEPQFNSKIAKQLSDDTGAKLTTLDPIGYDKSAKQDFANILINIAKSMNSCLSAKKT